MNDDTKLPELPVAEAWRVKGHYTEIFVDFGEANKYALAIGAKVEPLIVRDECREYALAAMQAVEPVAYWNGLKKAESNSGPWPTFGVEQDECTSIPLFTHPQATSEAEAMLDWLQSKSTLHTEPEILYVVDGYEVSVVRDGYATVEGPFKGATLRDAIRAAMKGAGS
jgi:hypothetical protein